MDDRYQEMESDQTRWSTSMYHVIRGAHYLIAIYLLMIAIQLVGVISYSAPALFFFPTNISFNEWSAKKPTKELQAAKLYIYI